VNQFKAVELCKSFGTKRALNEFSFNLKSREIRGLIGPNGAGKTTLMNIIAGNIFSDRGKILLNESAIKDRREIGISIDPVFVSYLSGLENLKLLELTEGGNIDRGWQSRIKELLKLVELSESAGKKVGEYSYGMRQRLGFVQAVMTKRLFLFLDEPFAGLDVSGRKIVKDYLRYLKDQEQTGILFSDHNLEDVKDICGQIICIKDGVKVYEGGINDRQHCKITLKKIPDNLVQELDDLKLRYVVQDRHLIIEELECLDQVLRICLRYSQIVNIRTSEDFLRKFFMGE
jgi:ABC-type multidrug transport system ATPase subunit